MFESSSGFQEPWVVPVMLCLWLMQRNNSDCSMYTLSIRFRPASLHTCCHFCWFQCFQYAQATINCIFATESWPLFRTRTNLWNYSSAFLHSFFSYRTFTTMAPPKLSQYQGSVSIHDPYADWMPSKLRPPQDFHTLSRDVLWMRMELIHSDMFQFLAPICWNNTCDHVRGVSCGNWVLGNQSTRKQSTDAWISTWQGCPVFISRILLADYVALCVYYCHYSLVPGMLGMGVRDPHWL